MLRHLTFLLLTYACLVAQTGAGDALTWGDWRTHLVAVPVAASVLLFEGPAAILWAAVVGLWWDGLSGGPLGESLLLMAGIAKLAISELDVNKPPVNANQNQPTAVPSRCRGAAAVIQTRKP